MYESPGGDLAGRQSERRGRTGPAVRALPGFGLVLSILLAPGLWAADAPHGEASPSEAAPRPSLTALPESELFRPLVGDPKEPRTFGSFLQASAEGRSTAVGAVGFGERWGLVRRPGQEPGDGWQLGLSGGVFAQFDMNADSKDLVNADYVVGFPLTWRRGAWSGRFTLYHQSSHLGDELLLRESPERINLSFEAFEALVARDLGPWRIYGGGDYLIDPEPADLASGVLHAGAEYRHARRTLSFGRIGRGRWIGAVDLKSLEVHDWTISWSVRAGLEFSPAEVAATTPRRWSFLLEVYEGPAPWGQFYLADVSYVGAGFHLGL